MKRGMITRRYAMIIAATLMCGGTFSAIGEETPKPLAPVSGTSIFSPAPSLTWEPVAGVSDYSVEIARDVGFSEIVVKDRTPIARFVPVKGLEPGTYYWRVGASTQKVSSGQLLTILAPKNEFPVPANADLAQMRDIVAQAARQTPARVTFAAGVTYRFHPEDNLITLKGVQDLEIDGNGADFVLTNPIAGLLEMTDCARITIRNITVDFDPLPFSVGTITAVDASAGTFTLKLDPGMPTFDAPHMLKHWTWGVILDGSTPGRMKTGSRLVINTVKERLVRSGDDVFTFALPDPQATKFFAPGDKWVQFSRSNGGRGLVDAEQCREITFLGVTSYAVSAGHYSLFGCDDVKVLGCRALIKKGRWFGGNADGMHVRSNRVGPWIEGCTFEGLGDDGIALYSKGISILEKVSDKSLRLDKGFFTLKQGSQFLVFNPATGEALAEERTVVSTTEIPAGNGHPAHWLVEFTPGFDGEVATGHKDAWQNTQVFDRTNQHNDFMIRRNTIQQIRRYGAILRVVRGAVEDNIFNQTSDSAITLQNEPRLWRNGLQSEDVIIQRNKITDCNFTDSSRNRGSIHVVLRAMGDATDQNWNLTTSPWKGHRNIAIRDNTISLWRHRAISVESARDVSIEGNRISDHLTALFPGDEEYPIYLGQVDGALVSGNTIADPKIFSEDIKVVDSENVKVEKVASPTP